MAHEKAKIISIQNQKGGVGKSTLANALAYDKANNGYNVALIDIDPQATQTGAFMGFEYGAFSGNDCSNIANIFKEKEFKPIKITTSKYINNPKKSVTGQPHYLEEDMKIDYYPANEELLDIIESDELTKDEKIDHIYIFLERLKTKYDRIIIDCPPSFGIITTAVVLISDSILVTIPTKNVDTDGMIGFFRKLDNAIEKYQKNNLKKISILPNMYDKRVTDAKETLADIKRTPNLLQAINNLRDVKCSILPPFPQRSVIQEAPSINNSFLVPFIMDYSRSKNRDLILNIENLSDEVDNYSN